MQSSPNIVKRGAAGLRPPRCARRYASLVVVAVTLVFAMGAPSAAAFPEAPLTRLAASFSQDVTYTVNSTNDPGDGFCNESECTLREAIEAANKDIGAATIGFALPGPAPVKIQPLTPLPPIEKSMTIDGTTQPGFTSCASGLAIELDGSQLTEPGETRGAGLFVLTGPTTIEGLAIGGFTTQFGGAGIRLADAAEPEVDESGQNTVRCNYLGLDASGTKARANYGGILIESPDNTIGGSTPEQRNIISASTGIGAEIQDDAGGGLRDRATRNAIKGNYIGTDVTGTIAIGNKSSGVNVNGPAGNTIGGPASGEGNLISGNEAGITSSGASTVIEGNLVGTNAAGSSALPNEFGVVTTGHGDTIGGTGAARNVISGSTEVGLWISEARSSGTIVRGNYIGTGADGTTPLGNGQAGVVLNGAANHIQVGGTAAGQGNVIAYNGGDGIFLEGAGSEPAGCCNVLESNSIYNNGELGIDLGKPGPPANEYGVNPNDPNDEDTGANELQNFPVLTGAAAGATTAVEGTLASSANAMFTLQFFASPSCDVSGNGEGKTFLGERTLTTSASGEASFNVSLGAASRAGEVITATATDPSGNTSEFSNCATTAPPPPAVSALSPSMGSMSGGTSVSISGTGFTGATAVRFGAVPAQKFTFNSDTSITAVAPAGGGSVDVTVTTASGTSGTGAASKFKYVNTTPEYGRCLEVSSGSGWYGDSSCTSTGGSRRYSWYPAFGSQLPLARTGFTVARASSAGNFLLEIAGRPSVACKTATGSGTYTGLQHVGNFTVAFGGCASTEDGRSCQTAGRPSGTIATNVLEGELGIIKSNAANPLEDEIGIDLFGVGHSAVSSQLTCGGHTSSIAGSVITPVATNAMEVTTPRTFSAELGQQVPRAFEGKPEDTLSLRVEGATVPATLQLSTLLTNEEGIEVSAVGHPAFVASRGSVPGTIEVFSQPGTNVTATKASEIPPGEPLPPGATAVVGGLSYEVTGVKAGGTVSVTLQLPAGSRPTRVYKLIAGRYTPIEKATISGDTVTVPITDGASNDQDGIANGVIVDPLVPVREPPAVSKVAPASGPASGGTVVTISGTDLIGATAVQFGALDAENFTLETVKGVTRIKAVTPPAAPGTVDVTVTTPEGTSPAAPRSRFKFLPTVTSLSPATGTAAGGASVTVTGSGFATAPGATSFKFGSTRAPSVTCASSSQCTIVTPAHAAGPVDVRASVSSVTSLKNPPADLFTFE